MMMHDDDYDDDDVEPSCQDNNMSLVTTTFLGCFINIKDFQKSDLFLLILIIVRISTDTRQCRTDHPRWLIYIVES